MINCIGIGISIYILSIGSHQIFVVIYHAHHNLIQFLATLAIETDTLTIYNSLKNDIDPSFLRRVSPLAHFVFDVSCESRKELQYWSV